MALGVGSGLFGIILPIDETNLSLNPSYEFGTFGVVAIQSATLGTSSGFQRYGAWSLSVTPNSNGTSGALLGTFTTGNGTAYSVGVWANVAAGVPMRIGIGDNAGLNLTSGTITFTGGGTWQWYGCGTVEAAQGTRGVVIQKTSGASVAPFYVDGLRISPWADGTLRQTTYIDGDQDGCLWTGAPHNSTSTRSGQYRGGGSVIALADLGLQVDDMLGVGMPPIENSSQSYAVVDGAQYQRTRAAARKFTLTAKPIVGTSLADFHNTRRTLIDAFKPDLVTPQQPTRFLYVGGQGTVQIDAYYEKGLELGNMDGIIAENAAISFAAYDPYWHSPTQQGTTLVPRLNLGSTNYIARRRPNGQWGTMGPSGSSISAAVSGVTQVNGLGVNAGGTVFIAGNYGSAAGTWSPHISMYYPDSNTFGTLGPGTIGVTAGEAAYCVTFNPVGTVFIGGNFLTIGGTAANAIGRWSSAGFGTLQGGTVDAGASSGLVWTMLYSPRGTLFLGGQYDTVAGTANSRNLSMWTGAFGTLGGTVGLNVGSGVAQALAWGLDNRLFLGGQFFNVNGSVGTSIAFWKDGSFGTMGRLGEDTNKTVRALGIGPNGVLYEAGNYTDTSAGSALRVSAWNGVQHQALGAGLNNAVFAEAIDQQSGDVYFAGAFTQAGSIPVAGPFTVWNGASYLQPDIGLFANGTVNAMTFGLDRSLYIAGNFVGTAQCASIGTIINTGRAEVFPTLRLRNLSASGTGRVYQLVNTMTGDGLYFNYVMLPGEQALLTLQPGQRSFQSSAQGNVFGLILPGSNLATWNLLPGTNYVSFFSDNDSLEASLFWQPRAWSIDGGTV